MNKQDLLKISLWLVIIIFFINSLAMKFHWYFIIWWFDMPMHFLGGIFIGFISIVTYLNYFRQEKLANAKRLFWLIFLSVLVVGVLWEIFESGVNFFTLSPQNPLLDTFSDLAFDLAGGFFAVLYLLYNKIYEKNINS